jgi:hypothetical protein
MNKTSLATLILLPLSFVSVSAQDRASVRRTVDPETCFLETISNMRSIDNPRLIRYNCSMRYIKMVESYAKEIDPSNASGATLSVTPFSFEVMGGALEMKFKNESNFTIISAFILFKTEANQKGNVYKLNAATPVEPFSVGTLITLAPEDVKGYSWGLVKLLGVKN